ncbi:ANTAR domain-containing protein [Paenibacillus tritici]|jgi:two-component system, response regulator / RNA-binding antiterminator|uniref:ANTAR domain-containing protein n=1 Tax=Paenibacillus tritici TaxID=1873425 RepID=A0ABX2DHX7_9BACL|nr:ANTAR domain-containing protein [Paenibacillus tritici]NQX44218.1 ANTAR domain-containing protein [Paenibacillus tritici]
MHSLLVIEPAGTENPAEARSSGSPDSILSSCGYVVGTAASPEQAAPLIGDADAFILNLPVTDISSWRALLVRHKVAPVLWWCTPLTSTLSVSACGDDIMVDGILSPAMKSPEIHWMLHFSSRQCFERKQWLKEREQLLSRIEERKWIDMAKGILSQAKKISESEAYDLLRKQAMNERKRIVDVATSIVKVYQMLQDQT